MTKAFVERTFDWVILVRLFPPSYQNFSISEVGRMVLRASHEDSPFHKAFGPLEVLAVDVLLDTSIEGKKPSEHGEGKGFGLM